MKWRQSIIYLIILLMLGGYFYYFEVVKKEEKEAAEKQAKKVFDFKVDSLQAFDIQAAGKKQVQLRKEAQWKIVEPVKADVDKSSLTGFLGALADLESQREVVASPQDLKPFGLETPPYKVRFAAGDNWRELQIGDKNPVGDGHYAIVNGNPRVFLIDEASWTRLNKGLDDLRKRELFSFNTDDVLGLEVEWPERTPIHFKRDESTLSWKSPDRPEFKIKESKLRNVLEQIQWLKAQKFLDEDIKNLDPYGLTRPAATVKLVLKDNKTVELQLATMDDKKKQLAALSSDLPAVVEVQGSILEDLPKNMETLEDRSLLALNKEEVTEVRWQVGDARGDVIQTGKDKWALKTGDGDSKPLKDPWHVSSLLWDLDQSEYAGKAEPPPDVPTDPHGQLELWKGTKKLQSFRWNKSSQASSEAPIVWIEIEGGSVLPVMVQGDVLDKIEKDLVGMGQLETGKK